MGLVDGVCGGQCGGGKGRFTGVWGCGGLVKMARASLTAQLVKNTLAMQETLVRFLGWEDPLEKG